ncbi:trans-sulfuration enzyme family protein [Seleniivibrio woodruffii]|uniref:Cysteine synthase /cystathionine gamma-synthase n=1 Tax=Seleniivibrio woodruffii TaxID=1078050 RepID=A0A4R1K6M2_9BACT|nr:PLP-dependent aspartate aminotransferase family protein [Seleniivibrio woodruffii]TCK59872.1 cysteine synthase /cystathionine gamma-synthase [Seleniivibrio woodruffii]TVZ35907.1 cysteine synthase /cystathionine gamma-synthase [Seleniivibrio woodruffii]
MKIETRLAQAGSRRDPSTGAVTVPVYNSATYRHPALGQSTGYDYSRTKNPTRQALEDAIADAENGARGLAFSSGLAAVDNIIRLLKPADKILVTEDLYGGTYRLFQQVYAVYGIEAVYVDTSDIAQVIEALKDASIKMIFVENPTNPLLKVADIKAISAEAAARGILTVVDNTFLSPCFQNPLDLGADVVLHSATKYLGGHNDVVAGVIVAKTQELGDRLAFFQNAVGSILGPNDAYLVLRGMKTLHLRVKKQAENALAVAKFLETHPRVTKVFYPGLESHSGHRLLKEQGRGFGAMVSFELDDPKLLPVILEKVKVFLFAESLGGVESLITFPAVQTHADIEPEVRERLGVTDRLLRASIGVEDADDLIGDLKQALESEVR